MTENHTGERTTPTVGLPKHAFGDCTREGCDELCPWDMVALGLDDTVCCSPDCARTVLETRSEPLTTVTLHDPQYSVDRDEHPGVDEHAVDIGRQVHTTADVDAAISELAALYPAPFRM